MRYPIGRQVRLVLSCGAPISRLQFYQKLLELAKAKAQELKWIERINRRTRRISRNPPSSRALTLRIGGNESDGEAVMTIGANGLHRGHGHSRFGSGESEELAQALAR